MGKHAILLLVLVGLGCHGSGEVSPAGSGGSAPPAVGGAGGLYTGPAGTGGAGPGSGGGFPGNGPPGGGGPGTVTDASAAVTVDAGVCPFTMAGTACGPAGATCSWSGECVARRCDCVNGTWACTERQMPCGGMCPVPQNARCGDSCTGNASNCLCHCGGGGPNYAGCACTGGRWQCSCGR
jgi:hypothetical protein